MMSFIVLSEKKNNHIVTLAVTLGAHLDVAINVPITRVTNTRCIARSKQVPESILPVASWSYI